MEIISYDDANFVQTPSQPVETRLRADRLLKVTHTHTHKINVCENVKTLKDLESAMCDVHYRLLGVPVRET